MYMLNVHANLIRREDGASKSGTFLGMFTSISNAKDYVLIMLNMHTNFIRREDGASRSGTFFGMFTLINKA